MKSIRTDLSSPGKRWVFLLLSVTLLSTSNVAYAKQETPGYRTANQDPKGDGMRFVIFKPKMLLLPFEIKYPESWYVREEFGGLPSLFISREPILAMADQYKVGMTIYYHVDFFVPQKEDPDSPLGQMAESVIKIRTWESTKEGFFKSASEQGRHVVSKEDTTLSGQPAFRIEWKTDRVRTITYCVKAGNHLMVWILESPPDEFERHSSTFKQMAEAFKFTR